MPFNIDESVLATPQGQDLQDEIEMREYERTTQGQMPAIAQLASLGAQQTWAGMQDVDDAFTNDEVDPMESPQRWKALDDQQKQIAMSTGQRGVEDLDMLDEMARYIPDMAMVAATGGASSPAIMGARGVAPMFGMGARALGAESGKKALQRSAMGTAIKRKGGDYLEDIALTAEQEFLKGELREDDKASIMESFSPEALAMEVGADFGIQAMAELALTPGRRRARKKRQNSRGYSLGSNAAEAMVKKHGNNIKNIAPAYETLRNNQPPEVAEGFLEKYQELNRGGSASTKDTKTKESVVDQIGKTNEEKKIAAKKQKERVENIVKGIEDTSFDNLDLDTIIKRNRGWKSQGKGKKPKQDLKKDVNLDELYTIEDELKSIDRKNMNESTAKKIDTLIEKIQSNKKAKTTATIKKAMESSKNLTDTQLKAAHRKDLNNEAAKGRGEASVYAKARANEVGKRKNSDTFKKARETVVPPEARTSTDNSIALKGYTYAKPEAVKAEADRIRATDDYETAVNDIRNAQDKAAAQKPFYTDKDGVRKRKALTLEEKAQIAKEYGKDGNNIKKVAASDIYNYSHQAGFKKKTEEPTSKFAKPDTKTDGNQQKGQEQKIPEGESVGKINIGGETKAEPKIEQPEKQTIKLNIGGSKKGTRDYTIGDTTYQLVKNGSGGIDVMLNGKKVDSAVVGGINNAKKRAEKHHKENVKAKPVDEAPWEDAPEDLKKKVETEPKKGGFTLNRRKKKSVDTSKVDESFKGTDREAPSVVEGNEAKYDAEKNEITIDFGREDIGETLDHEIVHALTDFAYDNGLNKPVDDIVVQMRGEIKNTKLTDMEKDYLNSIEDNQEFAVTVATKDRFFEAFDNIKANNYEVKPQSLIGKMFGVFKELAQKLSGNPTMMAQLVDVMHAQSQAKLEVKEYNIRYSKAIYNAPKSGMQGAEEFVRDNIVKPVALKVWAILKVIYDYLDKDHKLAKLIKGSYKGNLFGKILKDYGIIGSDIHRKIQEYSNEMQGLDTVTLNQRGNISEDIKRLLPYTENKLGLKVDLDEVKLADEIVGLDLQVLDIQDVLDLFDANFSESAVHDILSRKHREMTKYMSEKGITKEADFEKAVNFLVDQMLGRQKDKEYRVNAVNNASQLAYMYTNNRGLDKDFIDMLDQYLTFRAIAKKPPKEMMAIDRKNLKEILAIHRTSVNMFKAVNGRGPQYRKGYVGGRMDPYWEYEYMPSDVFKSVEGKEGDGWESFGFSSDGKYVHAKRQAAYLVYTKGATPTKQKHAKGGKYYRTRDDMFRDLNESPRLEVETVKQFNQRITKAIETKHGNVYEPYYSNNGEIRGIRSEMSEATKRRELGFDTTLSDSIANSIMSTQREAGYRKLSNEIEASLVKDVSDPKFKRADILNKLDTEAQFTMLRGSLDTIKAKVDKHMLDKHYDRVTPEIRAILPRNLKDIQYINKLYKDELIGYKNDFWFNSRGANLIEMYWRDAVQNFKASVIAKNPVAITTNAIGNAVMLMSEGASMPFVAKELMRAKKDIADMEASIKELNKYEVRLAMYEKGSSEYKSLEKKIDGLNKEITNSEAFIGVDSGWYQSTLDDFYDSRVTQNTPIARAAEAAYRKTLEKSGMDKNKIDNVVDLGCNAVLSQNSKAGRKIQGFIAGTDYASRLAMYRLKRRQGMGKVAAADLARDSFVDYRAILPKEINALRANGIIPFATWAYRMQPVLARQAYNNPIKIAALYGAYTAMSDDLGYVGDLRVGGWLPGTAFLDPSPIGGLPLEMTEGNVPTEILVPEIYGNLLTGNYDKVLGQNIKD